MAYTLEQLLGHVYLTGLIENVKTGIPDVLPKEFGAIRKETIKDMGRYTRVAGTRRVAKRIEYGAATRKTELKNIGTFDVKLATFGEHIQLDLETYMSLRAYDAYQVQNLGMQELDRQALQFKTRFDNAEIAMLYSMLALGAIYFNAAGDLLPSSSGAALTINYSLSANHQNQLNGIIGASWATAGTDIITDILQIRDQALFDTGYELGCAFYGRNIPAYFAANTTMKEYLARHQGFRDRLVQTNEIPDGLLGIDRWVRVSAAFFEDADGTNQTFFGGDTVVFTPPIDSSWFEWMDGEILVPSTINPMASLSAAANSFERKKKTAMWSLPTMNPVGAELHAKTVTLPILKFPDAIFVADVTP